MPVPQQEASLESALKALEQTGRLIKDRPQRQIWRFEVAGVPYILKFYPRRGGFLKRLVRGNPALREFIRLQWLLKANVPAPRPQSVLMGMHLRNQIGDAVVMQAIEPGLPLDRYFNDLEMTGQRAPEHRHLAEQIHNILSQLARAGLGHADLHLGNFLLSNDQIYLLDAYAVQKGGLKLQHLLHLAHSFGWYATQTDLLRAWRSLGPDAPMPRTNPVSARLWRKQLSRITAENRYFGRVRISKWSGHYFKHTKFPRPWSASSGMVFTADQWQQSWPTILQQIESDQFEILKRSTSGDVLCGEIILAGHPLQVVIKRPKRKHLRRYFDFFRGSRARTAWTKSWKLIFRDIPTAWPLLLMEKRTLGYVTDAIVIYERIDGPQLRISKLDAMTPQNRFHYLFQAGRLLRKLDNSGLYHRDAKSSNFIESRDPLDRPTPILVDVDGVHPARYNRWSLPRLLTSMKQHRQYTPQDSLALCQGYAPFARIEPETNAT